MLPLRKGRRRWSAALVYASVLLATPVTAEEADRGEVRAQIHALLAAYGEMIDARDFAGFAALFAENALGLEEPNYHLFSNEVVRFTGPNSTKANSWSQFITPGDGGAADAAMMASDSDQRVRKGGMWKSARCEVQALLPARQAVASFLDASAVP